MVANKVIVRNGQSLADICIQEYGTIEPLFDLAAFNQLSVSDAIVQGLVLQLPSAAGDIDILNYYRVNGITPTTGISASQEQSNYADTDYVEFNYWE